ncbi:Pre-mRNA-splicing factor SPF27 [Cyberlindnera fabianii]|uniref:Pre-mRNA-splicing factor SPF27 n=1 Tax=Cyberlindnera fabianii TaxID=36022 RepID=A0A1V2L9Z0_CYBFA|nr:Pre-mRNA-splicing factor SPF27 [Cyberlindnera fabianii]
MNYEPLDSLPCMYLLDNLSGRSEAHTNRINTDIDPDITEQERAEIDKLIAEELKDFDLSQIHQKVDKIFPLPDVPRLISNINPEDLQRDDFTLTGIDLEKYSDLENPESLQKSIAFTYLRNVSLKLNKQLGKNQWLIANEELSQADEMIKDEVSRKKRRIHEVNAERKTIQTEVKPVVDYLQERWMQSIQKNVDLGVAILQLKHNENS